MTRAGYLVKIRARPRIVVAALAAAAGASIGAAVSTGVTDGVDQRVRRRVRVKGRPRIVRAARGISALAAPHAHPIVAAAACAWITRSSGRVCASPLVASLATMLVDRGTRFVVFQQRPPGATHREGRDRLAYPSGHTAAATAISVATAIEAGPSLAPGARPVLYALAGAVGAAVGWSRLALDEHWVDDVVGGWAFGVAIGIASTMIRVPGGLDT